VTSLLDRPGKKDARCRKKACEMEREKCTAEATMIARRNRGKPDCGKDARLVEVIGV
jgi:hypothetical protein